MAVAMTVGASKIRAMYDNSIKSLNEDQPEPEADKSKSEAEPDEDCST
jgi:hypothetical protein